MILILFHVVTLVIINLVAIVIVAMVVAMVVAIGRVASIVRAIAAVATMVIGIIAIDVNLVLFLGHVDGTLACSVRFSTSNKLCVTVAPWIFWAGPLDRR